MKKTIAALSILALTTGFTGISYADEMSVMKQEIQELKKMLKSEALKREKLENKINSIEGRSSELNNAVASEEAPIIDIRNDNSPLSISGGVTSMIQGTSGNYSATDGTYDKSAATFSFDLSINARLAENHRFIVDLEGGHGDSVNDIAAGIGAISSPNYDPYNTTTASQTDVTISGAAYEGTFCQGNFIVTAGKIDPHGFFDENAYANDETAQFNTAMFVRAYGSIFSEVENYYAPGVAMQYAVNDYLDVTWVGTTNSYSDLFNNFVNVLQVNIKPQLIEGQDGNYRFFVSQDNRTGQTNISGGQETDHTGYGLSIDQGLVDGVGIFGRYDWAEKGVSTGGTNVQTMWSVGVDLAGSLWGRDGDNIGIAYGSLDFNNRLEAGRKNEDHFEFYYNYEVLSQMHLTPVYQYIGNVTGNGGATYRDVSVYGVRGQFDF